jgi:hypothetical protein
MRRKETCGLSLLIRFNVGEPSFLSGRQEAEPCNVAANRLSNFARCRRNFRRLVPKAGRMAAAKLP